MQPLVINAALTGMVPQRTDSPYVPLQPKEIVADAKRCFEAGATILHLHARDADDRPTYERSVYEEIFAGVRAECPGVVISGSCSGRMHSEFRQRSQVLDAQPELASLTLGSLNFARQASLNEPEMIRRLAAAMLQRGVRPELEIFDAGMADFAQYLADKQLIRPPFYANLLLGSLGTMAATPDNLCHLVRCLPPGTTWAATGIGRHQFFVNSLAIAMGGHVRVGLEDALYYDWTDKQLATNAGLIDRIVRVASAIGRDIARPQQTRELLGLPTTTKRQAA
ncbi:MAG: 3-keto-5-aminohexanoate cleavage protein [Planctomycetales bacterium]|nr:3-keto-5-aminohexanoate cleavage protein [Planctomycetales bacterium]